MLNLLSGVRIRGLTTRKALSRAILPAELIALLVLAVMLTVMPEELLRAVATAATWMRDSAVSYRPIVAFVGLLMVGALTWSLLALLRAASAEEAGRNPMPRARQDIPRRAA